MASEQTPAQEIIKGKFGGSRVVSKITGADRNAVSQWYRIGIPAKYWPALVDAAAARGLEGVTFDALAAAKPVTAKAEAA